MVAVNLFVMGSLNNKCLVIFLVLLIFTEGFPGGSMVKNLPASTGDEASISGLGRFPWRRKWKPTPVSLPVKYYGQRTLLGYIPWGHKRVGHDLVTKQQQHIILYTIISKYRRVLLLQNPLCSICLHLASSNDFFFCFFILTFSRTP